MRSFGIFGVLVYFMKHQTSWDTCIVTTGLVLLSRVFLSSNWCVIYQWASEFFPTPVRGNGVSFGSVVCKFATMATPAFLALHEKVSWLPGIIFGSLCISAGVLSAYLPETRGKPQLQTFAEAQSLYTSKKDA